MRIHTDSIQYTREIRDILPAGVTAQVLNSHGSRKRLRAFELQLSGTSRRSNQSNTARAATWDEWGVVLAALFELDPAMVTEYYESAEYFHWATAGRFKLITASEQHSWHKWSAFYPVVTGRYAVSSCEQCGATQRHMVNGHNFSEINY